MQVNKLFVVLLSAFVSLLILSVASFAAVNAAPNTCTITTGSSCHISDYGVASFYFYGSSTDGHAENYTPGATSSGLNHHLCCDYNGTAAYITSGFCSHQPLFAMWDVSNGHVAQNRTAGAPYNVCAMSYDGFTMCDYNPSNGACNANQTLVGSIDSSSPWNSHFGESTTLTTNICCSFNVSITLQGVNIAQFEYWCGVEDNVCPEDYYNSTGGHPSCYPREDPDC